jgi:metal-responsive CopG/Arc/MetJ family transcriptional regulator
MEAVCVKMDEHLLKSMDETMKENNYMTRTEFIRESIRSKMRELAKEKAIAVLEKYRGASKVHVSDEEHERIREKVFRDFGKKHGLD